MRPTTDRVREALFSIIGPRAQGARIVDLYAGTGLIGFEALSRGAAHVTAIEKDKAHCRQIEANAQTLDLSSDTYTLTPCSVGQWLKVARFERTDIIVADPPYRQTLADTAALLSPNLAGFTGLLVIEYRQAGNPRVQWVPRLHHYGDTALAIYDFAGNE